MNLSYFALSSNTLFPNSGESEKSGDQFEAAKANEAWGACTAEILC